MVRALDEERNLKEHGLGTAHSWNYEGHEAFTGLPRHVRYLFGHERHHQSGIDIADALPHPEQIGWEQVADTERWGRALQGWYLSGIRSTESSRSSENLRVRLANANDYFRRKASEVYNDQEALDLLKTIHQDVVVDISNFDACSHGIPLSKLTAANFCEIGAKVIFITDAGRNFISSLKEHGGI